MKVEIALGFTLYVVLLSLLAAFLTGQIETAVIIAGGVMVGMGLMLLWQEITYNDRA